MNSGWIFLSGVRGNAIGAIAGSMVAMKGPVSGLGQAIKFLAPRFFFSERKAETYLLDPLAFFVAFSFRFSPLL